MKKNYFETILGIIIIFFSMFAIVKYYKANSLNIANESYELNSKFLKIGGVVIGNDVKLSGVKIGTVSNIELNDEILTEIEKYRTLVEAVHANEDSAILETAIDDFLIATNPFIDFYGELRYYTLLIELAEGYYIAEAEDKAEDFVMKVNREIKKQLQYFSRVSPENQKKYREAIQDVFLDYRFLLSIVIERSPQALKDTIQKDYEKTKALFAVEIE